MRAKNTIKTRVRNLILRARKAGFSVKVRKEGSQTWVTLQRFDNSFTHSIISLALRPSGRYSVAVRVSDHSTQRQGRRFKRGFGEANASVGTFEMIDRWAREKAAGNYQI